MVGCSRYFIKTQFVKADNRWSKEERYHQKGDLENQPIKQVVFSNIKASFDGLCDFILAWWLHHLTGVCKCLPTNFCFDINKGEKINWIGKTIIKGSEAVVISLTIVSILFALIASTFDINWTASNKFGTYRLCEQRWLGEPAHPSDRKPDPWPLWMAGHAQLQFVMTEC